MCSEIRPGSVSEWSYGRSEESVLVRGVGRVVNRSVVSIGGSPYLMMEVLGSGASGIVRKAWNMLTYEMVAIKEMKKSSPRTARYVQYEIENHSILKNGNVIRLHDSEETDDNKTYLVMEYAPLGNLRDYLEARGNKLPESKAKKCFCQLVRAVMYCHTENVASRDIKLENILLFENEGCDVPILKLADFGYSKHLVQHPPPETLCGPIEGIAPEMIIGGVYDARKVDVWTCGVVLFQMVTGKNPFSRYSLPRNVRSWEELAVVILAVQYDYPTKNSPSAECRDLIAKCLVYDPKERIDIGGIRDHPWLSSCTWDN